MTKITLATIEKELATLTLENGQSISLPLTELPTDSQVGDILFLGITKHNDQPFTETRDAKKILNELLSE
jgi:hypothetical protein